MIQICPNCKARISVSEHSGDFVHECLEAYNKTTFQDDISKDANAWVDADGTTGKNQNAHLTGFGAKNWGERSHIEEGKTYNYTRRGKRAITHRQRQHQEYIENPDKI